MCDRETHSDYPNINEATINNIKEMNFLQIVYSTQYVFSQVPDISEIIDTIKQHPECQDPNRIRGGIPIN